MPQYLYACDEHPKEHPTQEINHGMTEEPEVKCEECDGKMHKRPQAMRFYMDPFDVLTSWSTENWRRHKARSKGHKAPRFSPDKVNMPDAGIPGKSFETRSYKDGKL